MSRKRTDRRRDRRERRQAAEERSGAAAPAEDAASTATAPATEEAPPPAVPDRLNPIERLGGLILCPARTLRLVLAEEDWAGPVVVYALAIAGVTARQAGSGALHTAVDVREFLRDAPQVIVLMVAMQLAIPWAIQAAALNALARFHRCEHTFVATFATIGYARLPLLLGALGTVLLSSLGEVGEKVARPLALGLGALIHSRDGAPALAASILSNFNPMNVWGFVLVAYAVEASIPVSRRRALAYAAAYSTLAVGLQNLGFLLPPGPPR